MQRGLAGCGSAADFLVFLQPFQQGLGGPAVAVVVPVEIVAPLRIGERGALAQDVSGMVDDGDVQRRGHGAHALEDAGSVCLHVMRGQDDQPGAVAVGALLELLQSENRIVQGVLKDGRQVFSGEHASYSMHMLPLDGRRPSFEICAVSRVSAGQFQPGDGLHRIPGCALPREKFDVQPFREPGDLARGADDPGISLDFRQIRPRRIGVGRRTDGGRRAQFHRPVGEPCRVELPRRARRIASVVKRLKNGGVFVEVVGSEDQRHQLGAQTTGIFVVERQLLDLAGAADPES